MIHNKDESERKSTLLLISNDCYIIVNNISYCIRIFLIPVMCVYFSVFIFDILGDGIGFKHAKWSLLILWLLPILLFILRVIKIRLMNDNKFNSNSNVLIELEILNKEIVNPIQL